MESEGIKLFSSNKRKRVDVSPGGRSDDDGVVSKEDATSGPRKLADGVFPAEKIEFEQIGLSRWLADTCRVYGMTRPTDVQAVCIPHILEGRPLIGVAQTGSGKTATFGLPILQKLAKDPYGVFALVLTPTRSPFVADCKSDDVDASRELAFQIRDIFAALAAGMTFRHCVIVGGLKIRDQVMRLAKRPHVVISTPGRLASIVDSDGQLASYFRRLAFFVMDEADQILDVSFQSDLRKIMSILPSQRQTLLFSATMTKNLIKLQTVAMPNAFVYQVYEEMKTVSTLKQEYLLVPFNVKNVYLYHLLEQNVDLGSVIVFGSSCLACKLLGYTLEKLGLVNVMLHSEIRQKQRLVNLDLFKSRQVPILVATDLASRGLDIPTVDLVINYDLPHQPRDYVHRVGRTARVGKEGRAISFVSQHDIELVRGIETVIGEQLREMEIDERIVLKNMRRVFVAKKAAMLQIKRQEKQKLDMERQL